MRCLSHGFWPVVLLCFSVGDVFGLSYEFYAENTGSILLQVHRVNVGASSSTTNSVGTVSAGGNNRYGPYTTTSVGFPFDVYVLWRNGSTGADIQYSYLYTVVNSSDTKTGTTSCNGVGPVTQYIWSGCYTNRTGFPLIAEVLPSPSYTNIAPQPFLLVGPTNWVCFSLTNGVPFTAGWHTHTPPDAENPLGDHYFGPDTPAGTNSPGGGPGGLEDPPLLDGPSGSGGATSSDIGKLSTNIQTAVYRGAVYIGGKVGNVEGEMVKANTTLERIRTNTVPGTNGTGLDYSGVLGEIKTNTAKTYGALAGLTNSMGDMSGILAELTNGAAALSSAFDYMATSGLAGRFNTASNSVAHMPSVTSSGSAEPWSFTFCGRVIDLNPESSYISGILGHIKAAWTWLLLILFAYKIGDMLWLAVRSFTGAPLSGSALTTFGSLNLFAMAMRFGFAVVATMALGYIWDFAVSKILDKAQTYLGMIPDASDGFAFGGGSQVAWYLFTQAFPLSLFLTLLSTRLSLVFGMPGILFGAALATRKLIGK